MLVVIDPSVKSYDGHFLTYDRKIYDEYSRLGLPCVVLASKDMDPTLSKDLNLYPCFRMGLEGDVEQETLAESFYEDLVSGSRAISATSGAIFFLHTCTYAQIEPAARFIRENPSFRMIILLRYSVITNPFSPDLNMLNSYRAAMNSIKDYGVDGRITLVTDSSILQTEYQLVTELPIKLVPIPHVVASGITTKKINKNIVYLGNARGSKGFSTLKYLVHNIIDELKCGEWTAEFQSNVMFKRDLDSALAVSILRKLPVRLWEEELSLDNYQLLLERAGIVVIPYTLSWYHSQSSGVFCEALGAGKPVVVPRGTWMSEQLGASGAGMTYRPGDKADFVKSTKAVMQEIESFTSAARQYQQNFTQYHNPKKFMDELLSN